MAFLLRFLCAQEGGLSPGSEDGFYENKGVVSYSYSGTSLQNVLLWLFRNTAGKG